jgi:cytochrome bd-type quinol oxidase subunit 1
MSHHTLLDLSRWPWALTAAFYITRKMFWDRFAIGVVSGIVLTFEFGLNWAASTTTWDQ